MENQEVCFKFERFKYDNFWEKVTTIKYINTKTKQIINFNELYNLFINSNYYKMTNSEKIKQAEQLIKEVLIDEEVNNVHESSLTLLSNEIIDYIVNHWYCEGRCADVFQNKDGIEIDEYLNVEEIKLS